MKHEAQQIWVFILGLYRDNGKENGNYYSIIGVYIGVILGYIGIMEKRVDTTTICLPTLNPKP